MRAIHFTHGSEPLLRKLLQGAAAGLIATAPMSISMGIGWGLLPGREKYHLPPRLIVEELSRRGGIRQYLSEADLIGLTLFSHFAYGAATGAFYHLFEHRIPLPGGLKGALAGLAVWIGSYLGWLPALRVLRPATRHPWQRNLLMIVAHLIWGVSLGGTLQKLHAAK